MEFSNLSTVVLPKAAISELINAPEYSIKVYLLGIEGGDFSVNAIAARIGKDATTVLGAIEDLKKRGLLNIVTNGEEQKLEYVYAQEERVDSPAYPDAEFNRSVQLIFKDRQLGYYDMHSLYECLSVMELSKPILLVLTESAVNSHPARQNLPISYIVKLARKWSSEGVNTIAQAEHRAAVLTGKNNVRDVLRLLGMPGKNPSIIEEEIFEKWQLKWGMSFGAIEAAVPQTAKIQYPNMQYLDTIIEELYDNKIVDAVGAREYFEMRSKQDKGIKQILESMGSPRRTITKDIRSRYVAWCALGFDANSISRIASYIAMRGRHSIEQLDIELVNWHNANLHTEQEIRSGIEDRRNYAQKIRNMLASAGLDVGSTAGVEELYGRFASKYNHSDDVILYAAECSLGTRSPLKYMDKLLKDWHKKGCYTIDSAKAEHVSHAFAQKKGAPEYEQRDYSGGVNIRDVSAGEDE